MGYIWTLHLVTSPLCCKCVTAQLTDAFSVVDALVAVSRLGTEVVQGHDSPCLGSYLAYLADYCQPATVTAGRTRLRSANTQQLAVPRTNTGYGDRSSAVYGPSVWNSLPTALRMSDCSLTTFRTQPKT